MQGAPAEPGRRPAQQQQQQQQQFAGVDLRRPKGYVSPASAAVQAAAAPAEGDPCPRCESRDTKFCYYNNYNTAQPRHFCKGCRRYWTKGGTLRNVPVGGGTRKKPSSSSPPSSYAANSDKPKKPYKKKRRVVAPQEPVVVASAAASASATPVVVVAPASDSAKSTTTTATKETTTATTTTKAAATPTTTDPASEITTELVVPAAAEEEDSLAHLLQPDAAAVALGLGISDFPVAGKALDLEPADSFEWPAAFDLGSCWGGAGFADPDPAGLFLNLP